MTWECGKLEMRTRTDEKQKKKKARRMESGAQRDGEGGGEKI